MKKKTKKSTDKSISPGYKFVEDNFRFPDEDVSPVNKPIPPEQAEELYVCLQMILDQVDYQSGACRINEMVGGVLNPSILIQARDTLKKVRTTLSK